MHRFLPTLVVLVSCGGGPEVGLRNLTPVVAVAPEIVEFGEAIIGEPQVELFFVSNAGKRDLEVTLTLEDESGVYALSEAEQDIPPDESWEIGIQFLPDSLVDYDATLLIASNDPDNPLLAVPIFGTGIPIPTPDIDIQPLVLDFDYVDPAVDVLSVQFLEIFNTGTADLHIGAADQEGSGAFQLTTDPSYGIVAPGASTPVIVTYTPVNSDGDSGAILVNSDDADEPTVQVILTGNGGGNVDYPVPVIDCPASMSPFGSITLDGSDSYDPGGNEPLDFIWQLTLMPQGSEGFITNLITDSTDLHSGIAGDYEVQLQVVNSLGITSAPDRCLVPASPEDDLHVELTWDTVNVDLDLHLVEDGSEIFQRPGDCNFCNGTPQWGSGGAEDDPDLAIDDRSDGPENTRIESPADGTYHIKVHYFDNVGGPATTATITVWAYGAEVFSSQKILEWNEVWDVGQVNWPAGTVGVDSSDPYTAPTRACY